MAVGKSVKILVILISCLVLGAGLEACSSKSKPVQTGLWARARRTLMVAAYNAKRGPAVTVTTATGTKLASGEAPEGEPQPGKDETGTPPETSPSEGGTATRSTLIPTFGSAQGPQKILTPEVGTPGFFAGVPRNIGSPVATPKAAPQGNPPSYMPSTSLAGSPKIQAPSATAAAPGSSAAVTQGPTSSVTSVTPMGTPPGSSPTPPPPPAPTATTNLTQAPVPGLQPTGTSHPAPEEGTKVATIEGTLGSSIESAILPSLDVLYFSLPGQGCPEFPSDPCKCEFDKYAMERLDFNIWQMASNPQLYDNTATACFYTERTYQASDPGIPTPTPEGCSREDFGSNGSQWVKLICKGPFGFIDGHLLRVVACGVPNEALLNNYPGTSRESKLAAYLGKAWLEGDTSIWDDALCPDRRYLDYPFVGAASRLTGVLESGYVYFITQFPRDYLENQAAMTDDNSNNNPTYDYGVIKHVAGGELGTYASNEEMNNFLYKGSIVQVVVANYTEGVGDGGYTNTALADLLQGRVAATFPEAGVPSNAYCQVVSNWDEGPNPLETALLNEVNQARSLGGNYGNGSTEPATRSCGFQGNFEPAPALTANATLRCAARVHSKDMKEGGFFAHVNPVNFSMELNRIYAAGTDAILQPPPDPTIQGTVFGNGGENIAKGLADPKQIVQEWLNSPGHCANLMNPSFTHLGLGYVPESSQGPLVTMTLGRPWE